MSSSIAARAESEGDDETGLWRSREVAAFLGVSTATLSRWRRQGVGPGCVHVAGIARYRPTTVRAWIESMEEHNGGAAPGA